MDPVYSGPFQEHEKRYLLTEMLKASTIPIERLLNVVQEGGPPAWEHIALPHGRTMSQCKAAYDSLLRNVPALPPPAFSAPPPPLQSIAQKRKSEPFMEHSYMGPVPPAKRRQSGVETIPGARDIRPKPPNGGSPVSMASSPAPPQKRRGRPPKTEVERRTRDAIQRGELFPAQSSSLPPTAEEFSSPYAPIAPSPAPAPGPPTPQAPIEQTTPEIQADDSPGKKKRQRAPAKPPKAPPPRQPGESSFSVNPQVPMVREPQVQAQTPNIASVTETVQMGPAPEPASTSTTTTTLPPASEATTSAESQPPAEAKS
ncbi:hypothetical protein EG329_008555 [Mollisiaceae sp. DMI_Dod_QoI]|nr:hypothetical protein EG329_008555 [Helotiales sp. DMI_Dod_QoI]